MTGDVAGDRFGNPLDPAVGYARGSILASSNDELRRLAHARRVLQERFRAAGPDSVAIFTGNQRDFPIRPDDRRLAEEWTGPAVFWADLAARVRKHLGGTDTHEIAVFNRASAGLIAAISAIAAGGAVATYAARRGATHVSVVRGAAVASARLIEVSDALDLTAVLAAPDMKLLVVTPASSELDMLDDAAILQEGRAAMDQDVPVLLDDAYGARLRPVLTGGPPSLSLPIDLAISNSDKAGLEGPRAGFMAGRADLVSAVAARAAEYGMEARAPIALGVLRSLEAYTPDVLRREIEDGARLREALAGRVGAGAVRSTPLGPLIAEEDVLSLVAERSGRDPSRLPVVPAEASSALGMLLLRDAGILTVNVAGAPGARVSLRLKPVPGALDAAGGPEEVAAAVDQALDRLALDIETEPAVRTLILGEEHIEGRRPREIGS